MLRRHASQLVGERMTYHVYINEPSESCCISMRQGKVELQQEEVVGTVEGLSLYILMLVLLSRILAGLCGGGCWCVPRFGCLYRSNCKHGTLLSVWPLYDQ